MCNKLRVFLVTAALFLTACSSQGYTRQDDYDQGFSDAELDQMLAPIALYPDALLSQILMAATYPEEVREAATWSIQYPELEGQDAVNAVSDMPWDPSVKSLVAFPELLSRMDVDSLWTQRLGDAYLMQEADVLDAIQRLRDHAYAAGNLDRLDHVRVYRQNNYIYIDPIDPAVIYVPYYHPGHFYANWWWPDYPPHYWRPPVGYHSGLHFYWGHGFHVAPLFFFSTFHWHDRHIVVYDRHEYSRRFGGSHYRSNYNIHNRYEGAQRWRHNPDHRHGVRYPQQLNHRYSRQRQADYDRHWPGRGDPRLDRYQQRGSPDYGRNPRSQVYKRDDRQDGRYGNREPNNRSDGHYDRQRDHRDQNTRYNQSNPNDRRLERRSPSDVPDHPPQDNQRRNPELNFRDNGRQPNPNQARAESNRPQDVRSNPSTVNTRQSDGNPVINPRQRALQRMNTPEHQQQTPGRPSYRDQIDARRATESSMRQRNDSGQHRAQPGWQRSEQHGVSNASRRNFNEQAPRQRTAGQQRPGSDNWRNARTSSNSESPRDRGGAGERGGFGERSHSQR